MGGAAEALMKEGVFVVVGFLGGFCGGTHCGAGAGRRGDFHFHLGASEMGGKESFVPSLCRCSGAECCM